MRYLWAFAIILVVLPTSPALGQQNLPFSGGVFLAFGVESTHTSGPGSPVSIPLSGVYADWMRPRVHPGLDLRSEDGTLGIHGPLVGPRASIDLDNSQFHPYIEALFGPNHTTVDSTPPSGSTSYDERTGITSQAVVGLDVDLTRHLRWRLFEYTRSRFTGIPGSHTQALTMGLVLHL